MNKHKWNKIKENSNTVRHLIIGQIITTQNLVAIKEVRHAGQWSRKLASFALVIESSSLTAVSFTGATPAVSGCFGFLSSWLWVPVIYLRMPLYRDSSFRILSFSQVSRLISLWRFFWLRLCSSNSLFNRSIAFFILCFSDISCSNARAAAVIWDSKRAARLDDCASFESSAANAADCAEDVPDANMSVRLLSFIIALESKLSGTPEFNKLFGSGEGIGVIFVCVGVKLFSRLVLHFRGLFRRLRSRFFTSLVTRFRFSTVLLGGSLGSEGESWHLRRFLLALPVFALRSNWSTSWLAAGVVPLPRKQVISCWWLMAIG